MTAPGTRLTAVLAGLVFLLGASTGCSSDSCALFGTCGGVDVATLFDTAQGDPGPGTPEMPLVEVPVDPNQGHFPPDATPQQIAALKALNQYRVASGLGPVDEHEALNAAAQSHAEFIVTHCQDYKNEGLSVHKQNPDWDGFTGTNAWNRTAHFGYQSNGVAEVIGFVNNPEKAVDGWMGTLYHRLPLLDPATIEVGYGNSGIGGGTCTYPLYKKADVMDLSYGFVEQDVVVVYPPDGAVDVPPAFDGYESPQPPKPPDGYPSGTIITVQFGKSIGFKVLGHHLLENATDPVEHRFLAPFADATHDVMKDPNASMADNNVSLYAHKPLKSGTTYRAIIDLERGGKPLHIETTFVTK